MKAVDLDYDLPPELIAQRPADRRDASRLLVYDRASGDVRHRRFADLPEELRAEALFFVNDTRVLPARLHLRRETGGAVEVLLVEQLGGEEWEGLARPSRKLRPGERLGGGGVRWAAPGGAGWRSAPLAGGASGGTTCGPVLPRRSRPRLTPTSHSTSPRATRPST